jgi:hypothetical protein
MEPNKGSPLPGNKLLLYAFINTEHERTAINQHVYMNALDLIFANYIPACIFKIISIDQFYICINKSHNNHFIVLHKYTFFISSREMKLPSTSPRR